MDTKVDTGIAQGDRNAIAEGLGRVLADTYTLYLKTHNYHWNVTGPQFRALHLMFEEQYRELWAATDEIAERIRALGLVAPRTYGEMTEAATIKSGGEETEANAMLKDLVSGHEAVVATIRKALELADENDDEATADLLAPRVTAHEKSAWMLRSTIG